jgi:DHA1 family tetracycline resistance protein-like MFS transporter
LFVLPESLPPERRSTRTVKNPLAALSILGHYPIALRLAGSLFLVHTAQFALHATWQLYTKRRYGWDDEMVGWSLGAVGLGAIVVQGGLARRLVPRLGEPRSLLIGLLIGIGAYLGYALSPTGAGIFTTIAFASLGGIAGPACQALITRSVRGDEQGAVQGSLTAVQNLANIVGPVLGASVFAWSIDASRSASTPPGLVYLVSATLAAASLLVAFWALRGQPRT